MMSKFQKLIAVVCGISLILTCAVLLAQDPPAQQPPPPPAPVLTPDQLDTLVAPVALYPDPLLSQVLAASTYPLEVVEANQWLLQNKNLKGQPLLDAARQQNWDASVQALVALPDVLTRLNQDVRWTTDLGNAFLAQQADVMAAVQRMRGKAEASGKLKSDKQMTVTDKSDNGQNAIVIEPADPQVIYVPTYNPEWVWGPPIWGVYPPLFYPGIGIGLGFGPGIYIGGFFGGCCGWGAFGWGWGFNWFGGGILVNNYFLHRYGFNDFHGGGFRGTEAWAHDPAHRQGVPYPNRALSDRYRGAEGARGVGRAGEGRAAGGERGGERGGGERGAGQRFGSQGFERQNSGGSHSAFGGIHDGGQTRIQSDHGFSTQHGGGFGGGGFGGGGFHGGGGGGGFHGGGGRR